jgi:hypothetical protein
MGYKATVLATLGSNQASDIVNLQQQIAQQRAIIKRNNDAGAKGSGAEGVGR